MTPDAALDHLAYLVGLRLMGPDDRRRLRLALATSHEFVGLPGFDVDSVVQLDMLLEGRRPPETLQDHVDIARARQERAALPFNAAFWANRVADLVAAGFAPAQAAQLVAEVRGRVDPARGVPGPPTHNEERASC